jgi:hypothetical protein
MNIRQLNIQATVSLTAMGLLTVIAPSAEAVTFNMGDQLSGNVAFQVIGDSKTSLNFDFLNSMGKTGAGGSFGVNETSTGGFEQYINSGATNNRAYRIKDIDLGTTTSISNFLEYNDNDGDGDWGKDEWSMDWNNISIETDFVQGTTRFVNVIGDAIFRSTNTVPGSGGLTSVLSGKKAKGQIIINQGGSASLDYTVDDVPEPFTILGTAMAFGFAGLCKGEYDKKKKKQKVTT